MLEFMNDYTQQTFPSKVDGVDPLKWFLRSCTIGMINDLTVAYADSRSVHNETVKSHKDGHHAAGHVKRMVRLFRIGVNHLIPCGTMVDSLNKSKILIRLENKRVPADEMKRRTYTDDEIDSMLLCVVDDPMGSLILTLLREVGLRNGALTHMTYDQVVTRDHVPRTTCIVPEKAKSVRQFVTSTNLQKRIIVYVHYLRKYNLIEDPSKFFIFNTLDHHKPAGKGMIGRLLKNTATRAGVAIHVHPHAFRHTLVGKLMKAGNDISTVSKFMGHKSTQTTEQFYWLSNIKDLADTINNPFMATYHTKAEEKEAYIEENAHQRKKVDVALRIIHSYNTILSECIKNNPESEALSQFKNRVFEDMPDLGTLLKNIAGSISDSTTTSSSE
jgi:integrase